MTSQPDQSLSEPFRTLLRGMASSVTIISTEAATIRYGMVATAVMSLSLQPPSIVLAVNQSASIHAPLHGRGAFAINVLSHLDEHIARGFARSDGENRFSFGPWASLRSPDPLMRGLPYLVNTQASIFCKLRDSRQAGTHSLLIADVADLMLSQDRRPLMYCDGTYWTFTSLSSGSQVSPSPNFAAGATAL